MQASNSFKLIFLKKLLMGIHLGNLSSKNMTLLDRKNVIKLSADVALAFARDGRKWGRALIAEVIKQEKNQSLVRGILGEDFERLTEPCQASLTWKRMSSKKIVKRVCNFRRIKRIPTERMVASAIAKRMVKKKTQILKCLVPGGKFMDDFSLLDESIDYIISLKAQVDVMRKLTNSG